jgi:hypothetical protein
VNKIPNSLPDQPDESPVDEAQQEAKFRQMIERGLKDLDSGRFVSNDQMKRDIESWRQ